LLADENQYIDDLKMQNLIVKKPRNVLLSHCVHIFSYFIWYCR